MGKYDKYIESSKAQLAEAEKEYADAVIKMADAAPGVRQFVLGNIQQRMDEARSQIDIFTAENARG